MLFILQKEVEDLRKQVSDKDDLILKAGDAMNLLVNKHKEEVSLIKMQAQQEVETYKERLDILQQVTWKINVHRLLKNVSPSKCTKVLAIVNVLYKWASES